MCITQERETGIQSDRLLEQALKDRCIRKSCTTDRCLLFLLFCCFPCCYFSIASIKVSSHRIGTNPSREGENGFLTEPIFEFLAGILNTRNSFHSTDAEAAHTEIIVCEHRPSEKIRCEKGGKIIVLSANYGRLNIYTCPFGKIGNVTNCRAPNSLDKVREMCQNQTSCTLTASNELFHPDPCPTIQKYLRVEYYCFYY